MAEETADGQFGGGDGVTLDVRQEITERSGFAGRFAHGLGKVLSNGWFIIGVILFGIAWMVVNSGWFEGIEPFDPYPFTFLATLYSVAGPIAALLVLLRQHRDQHITELRDEVSLQVDLHVEQKVTMLLRMLDAMRKGREPEVDDEEVGPLLESVDPEELMEHVREHLAKDEGEDPAD